MKKRIVLISIIAVMFIFLSSMAIPKEVIIEPTVIEEPELIDRVAIYKEHPEILKAKLQPILDAKWLATIADAVAPNSDTNCKLSVMQCIVNRTRTIGFPDTIEDVCMQKNQWQGYNSDSEYTEDTLKLAKEFVDGLGLVRITSIESNLVYMRVTASGLYFRERWDSEDERYVPFYSGPSLA